MKQNSKNSSTDKDKRVITTVIRINKKTGEMNLTRDHQDLVKLSKEIGLEDSSFEEFFDSKPEDIDGNKDYTSFCG